MLIPMIVVAVLAILLIFCLFKSAQTWNWVQITSTALIFLTAIFAGIAASQSLKTRTAWKKQYNQNESQLASATETRDQLMYGPSGALEYGPDSLRGVATQLRLEQIGKGRVWRGGSPSVQGDQIVVGFQAGPSGASPAAQMVVDMLLFGFADGGAEVGAQTVSVPVKFLGTFKVVATAADSVTVQPVFIAEANEVATPTTSWTFFERMPGDYRDAFVEDFRASSGLAESDAVDFTQFREALKTKYLPAASMGLAEDSAEYEALLDEFTFDGFALNEINAWVGSQGDRRNPECDPDTQQRRVTLRFGANSQSYTVDSATGKIATDGSFNFQGEAIDPQLKWGEDITFKTDEEITVDKYYGELGFQRDETNRQAPLVDIEDAEVVNESFERELRDYPYLLEELGTQTAKLDRVKQQVDRDIEGINQLVADARQQINNRDVIIDQLQSDITKLRDDLALVTDLLDKRTREFAQKQEQIRTYYKQIMEMYKQMQSSGDALNTSRQKGPANLAGISK